MRKLRFIGVYDYTVVLTYISLISSVIGMTKAIHGDYKAAIFCLALSGICCVIGAINSAINNKKLADYMRSLEHTTA